MIGVEQEEGMKRIIGVLATVLFAALAFGQETDTSFIAKGDQFYDQFKNEEALQQYQMAYEADTLNCEALWKLTRAHVDVGEVSDEEEQRTHYYTAETFGRKAVAACPDNSDTHLQLAIAIGRVALMEGGKKKVSLSGEVKSEAEKAIELNPNDDIAHHVLARWHREVANLSGILKAFAKILYGGLPPASNEEAIEHFKKAIEIAPDHINHHLELGITYEEIKEWALAKAEYDKVMELPVSDSDDPDHKKEAEERLKKVEGKIK
jgi:tetratricopeptide (TPR) repeat protein